MYACLWPGRADRRLGLVAGKLTFAGTPRLKFRESRIRPLMAESSQRDRQIGRLKSVGCTRFST